MPPDRGRGETPPVLAVDGGNSKADAVLMDRSGAILGLARHFGRSNVGGSGSIDALNDVITAACAAARIDAGGRPVASVGIYCLAGADLPTDNRRIERALGERGWTRRTMVHNDTFAVLRAGTDRGWGVAVVCGAGMNCVGVGPTGRTVRFAALGPLSGDLAPGGEWVGLAALSAAIRAGDGRGERTQLERTVPEHFGMRHAESVMHAMYRGRLPSARLVELPPLVFRAAASGDVVARRILDQLASEVVSMAGAAIRRLRLTRSDVDVVLGGGMFRADDPVFLGRVRSGIEEAAPRCTVVRLEAPPLLGAALMGLDAIGASRRAEVRLRESIGRAMAAAERRLRAARQGASSKGR